MGKYVRVKLSALALNPDSLIDLDFTNVGLNDVGKILYKSPPSPYRAPQQEEHLDVEGISALTLILSDVCV